MSFVVFTGFDFQREHIAILFYKEVQFPIFLLL